MSTSCNYKCIVDPTEASQNNNCNELFNTKLDSVYIAD